MSDPKKPDDEIEIDAIEEEVPAAPAAPPPMPAARPPLPRAGALPRPPLPPVGGPRPAPPPRAPSSATANPAGVPPALPATPKLPSVGARSVPLPPLRAPTPLPSRVGAATPSAGTPRVIPASPVRAPTPAPTGATPSPRLSPSGSAFRAPTPLAGKTPRVPLTVPSAKTATPVESPRVVTPPAEPRPAVADTPLTRAPSLRPPPIEFTDADAELALDALEMPGGDAGLGETSNSLFDEPLADVAPPPANAATTVMSAASLGLLPPAGADATELRSLDELLAGVAVEPSTDAPLGSEAGAPVQQRPTLAPRGDDTAPPGPVAAPRDDWDFLMLAEPDPSPSVKPPAPLPPPMPTGVEGARGGVMIEFGDLAMGDDELGALRPPSILPPSTPPPATEPLPEALRVPQAARVPAEVRSAPPAADAEIEDFVLDLSDDVSPPVVEAPAVEAPAAEAPAAEAPVVEAPVVEAPVVEAVAAPVEAAEAPAPVTDEAAPTLEAAADEADLEVDFDLDLNAGDEVSLDIDGPPDASEDARVEAASRDDEAVDFVVDDDAGSELVIDEGEESEVDLDAAGPSEGDRGALLAASVTSRKRGVEGLDRLFAADARAEARSRAEMLVDEAQHCENNALSAEWLALAAELFEGVLGDRGRARSLAAEALARAPSSLTALRVLRRIALAERDFDAALGFGTSELDAGQLGADEAIALRCVLAELAARAVPEAGVEHWAALAAGEGQEASLASLFWGAAVNDDDRVVAALEAWGRASSGGLASSIDVARARRVEGAQTDTALLAIRDAVARDASDAGAWLAMARIGLAKVQPAVFREGLKGLVNASAGGALGNAADAIDRALANIVGEPVKAGAIDDDRVAGWLVAHALRDAGGDASAQRARGLEGPQRALWEAHSAEAIDAVRGRFLSLREAAPEARAVRAATLLGGEAAGFVEAALRAVAGRVNEEEVTALGQRVTPQGERLAAALSASTAGLDAAERGWPQPATRAGLYAVAAAESALRAGHIDDALGLAEEAVIDGPSTPAGLAGLRRRFAWGPTLSDAVDALRAEADAAEGSRAAGLRMLGASLAASVGVPGAADDALRAAEALDGELAAAELGALYSLRGELDPEVGAGLLERASSRGDSAAHRVGAVRAALRRAGDDPDAAAEVLWSAWQKSPRDASLGALVLRAPSSAGERSAAVLKALTDAAHGQAGAGGAAVALGLLHASALSDLTRHAEAAQAVARARTQALTDPALEATEERLWLRAGMFAEVAERAFDQLKSATTDEARIVAYEKLAELDRTYRGDVASSVLSFQAILELAPGHMASLRTLERYFGEQGRNEELLTVYARLARYAEDPQDALAFAHAGARLASREVEADSAVSAEFYRVALERALFDRRSLLALEAETRRLGDIEGFAGVETRLATLVTDPAERATALLRAAEGWESLGDDARALEAYEAAHEADPGHVGVLEGVAAARIRDGQIANAAEALEALGRAYRVNTYAVESLFDAGVMWRAAGEPARALVVAEEALSRDPRHAQSFDLACELLRSAGDIEGLLEVVSQRAAVDEEGGDAAFLAGLHAEAAGLSEKLDRLDQARDHWRAVVSLDAERLDALRALVRLSPLASDWTNTADAMIRLAKSTQDNDERVEMLFGLGDVFERHLHDGRRAEAAWRRALQFDPTDRRTLARLADLHAAAKEPAKESEALLSLVQRAPQGAERVQLQLRLAAVYDAGLSEPQKAEQVLESARREAPTDLDVLRALAAFHTRRGSFATLHGILDRAALELRRVLDRDPARGEALVKLAEVLELRGLRDGAKVVAAVGVTLGETDAALTGRAPEATFPPGEAGALAVTAVDLLSPPAITAALREVLARVCRVLDPLVPFDPRAMGAEPLGERAHPWRGELVHWASIYDLGRVEILVAPTVSIGCLPVYRTPATVVVPRDAVDDAAGRAAVARAMTLMALSLSLPLRLPAQDFALSLAAIFRQFEPMYRGNVDAARLDDLARKLTRDLPRAVHAEAAPFAYEALNRGSLDADAIHAGALELGDRVALLASGDLPAALRLLGPGDAPLTQVIQDVAPAGRLVRVAISDRFVEARRIALGETPGPTS